MCKLVLIKKILSRWRQKRHPPQIMVSVLLFVYVGCASTDNVDRTELDYNVLLTEQIEIHQNEALTKPYRQILEDFQTFKRQLYATIKDSYAIQFREDELAQIRELLTETSAAKRCSPEEGTAIFRRFRGSWRGHWFQNRQTTTYEQSWSSPYRISGGLIAQKVIIHQPDRRSEKPGNEIVAINSYNPKTNMILGAVDVADADRQSMRAPHLGFYIDASTLIWIACFGHDSESPAYSFFFEKVFVIDRVRHYRVRALGFHWNRKTNRLLKVNWREGHYIQTKPVVHVTISPYAFDESPR